MEYQTRFSVKGIIGMVLVNVGIVLIANSVLDIAQYNAKR